MAKKHWGWHLILDVTECDRSKIKDQDFLKSWVTNLVKEIKMVAYGDPQVIHFGHGEPHLAGNTVLQFIETSNIVAHYCDEFGDAYIDVFSCKEFNPAVVIKNINDIFQPKAIMARMLLRGAEEDVRGKEKNDNYTLKFGYKDIESCSDMLSYK